MSRSLESTENLTLPELASSFSNCSTLLRGESIETEPDCVTLMWDSLGGDTLPSSALLFASKTSMPSTQRVRRVRFVATVAGRGCGGQLGRDSETPGEYGSEDHEQRSKGDARARLLRLPPRPWISSRSAAI